MHFSYFLIPVCVSVYHRVLCWAMGCARCFVFGPFLADAVDKIFGSCRRRCLGGKTKPVGQVVRVVVVVVVGLPGGSWANWQLTTDTKEDNRLGPTTHPAAAVDSRPATRQQLRQRLRPPRQHPPLQVSHQHRQRQLTINYTWARQLFRRRNIFRVVKSSSGVDKIKYIFPFYATPQNLTINSIFKSSRIYLL